MNRIWPEMGTFAHGRRSWMPSGANPTFTRASTPRVRSSAADVVEVADFGSNPGALTCKYFRPPGLEPGAPLVVLLHGCGQNAVAFADASGWTALARLAGFALLLPEQRPANNPHGCFSWFDPEDNVRDAGEALSLRQMIEWMVSTLRLDGRRIFVTGLSAGGAMSAVMLAVYPDLFAGGAVVAGLPYRAASSPGEALAAMAAAVERPAPDWGKLVLTATGHRGPWPRISIWHGREDQTVVARHAHAIEAQWRHVHWLKGPASQALDLPGLEYRCWFGADDRPVVETVLIEGMGHGLPIDARGRNGKAGGIEAPYVLDVGISAPAQIARFWAL